MCAGGEQEFGKNIQIHQHERAAGTIRVERKKIGVSRNGNRVLGLHRWAQ